MKQKKTNWYTSAGAWCRACLEIVQSQFPSYHLPHAIHTAPTVHTWAQPTCLLQRQQRRRQKLDAALAAPPAGTAPFKGLPAAAAPCSVVLCSNGLAGCTGC
jgi:hypothetical protein